jgi:hypothetical protein
MTGSSSGARHRGRLLSEADQVTVGGRAAKDLLGPWRTALPGDSFITGRLP